MGFLSAVGKDGEPVDALDLNFVVFFEFSWPFKGDGAGVFHEFDLLISLCRLTHSFLPIGCRATLSLRPDHELDYLIRTDRNVAAVHRPLTNR